MAITFVTVTLKSVSKFLRCYNSQKNRFGRTLHGKVYFLGFYTKKYDFFFVNVLFGHFKVSEWKD